MKNQNWLILSHGFNMDGRAASQTITDKIPYLVNAGVKPQILSAVTGKKDKKIPHKQLLPFGGMGLRFDLRFWLRRKVGKDVFYKLVIGCLGLLLLPLVVIEKVFFGLSSQSSWAIPAAIVGIYRVKRKQVDLVYSTGGAWSAHLAGYWIWKVTRVPWIVELHDPMVQVADEKNTDRETRLLLWLENKICSYATLVWWFTEGAEASARRRNPQLANRGFNELAGANPPSPDVYFEKSEKLRFSHFGSLTEGRSLVPFLQGISRLIEKQLLMLDDIEINVYGGLLDASSKQSAKELGLEKIMIEHGRIEADENEFGRSKIMRAMKNADVLLLMHGHDDTCKEYIPSKFYEYLFAERSILAFHHANQQFLRLLTEINCYEVESEGESTTVLNQIAADWKNGSLNMPTRKISTENLVNKMCDKLSHA